MNEQQPAPALEDLIVRKVHPEARFADYDCTPPIDLISSFYEKWKTIPLRERTAATAQLAMDFSKEQHRAQKSREVLKDSLPKSKGYEEWYNLNVGKVVVDVITVTSHLEFGVMCRRMYEVTVSRSLQLKGEGEFECALEPGDPDYVWSLWTDNWLRPSKKPADPVGLPGPGNEEGEIDCDTPDGGSTFDADLLCQFSRYGNSIANLGTVASLQETNASLMEEVAFLKKTIASMSASSMNTAEISSTCTCASASGATNTEPPSFNSWARKRQRTK